MTLYPWLRPFIFLLPPECAHHMALKTLASGLLPSRTLPALPRLTQNLWGLSFPHPVGLAAGCDKNASAIDGIASQGFGFIECGTVTPHPQAGNPKPRVFRLKNEQGIINRLGFNNAGLDVFVTHVMARKSSVIVGGNIGKNKDSEDAIADYVTCLKAVYRHVDYITVNISSPNTQGLRELQAHDALKSLIEALHVARDHLVTSGLTRKPIIIKIAPDLSTDAIAIIGELALEYSLDGLIVSNTTTSRPRMEPLPAHLATGGLSGKPLLPLSTMVLAQMARATRGTIPLIGVGGISNAQDAYNKILHGASLVQLYSALVFHGFGLAATIARELDALLAREGVSHISEVIGQAL